MIGRHRRPSPPLLDPDDERFAWGCLLIIGLILLLWAGIAIWVGKLLNKF